MTSLIHQRVGRLYGLWLARARWNGRVLPIETYMRLARCVRAEWRDEDE